MTAKEAPPNAFLTRLSQRTAGVHWRNVLLAGGGLFGTAALVSWFLFSGDGHRLPEPNTRKPPGLAIEEQAPVRYDDFTIEEEPEPEGGITEAAGRPLPHEPVAANDFPYHEEPYTAPPPVDELYATAVSGTVAARAVTPPETQDGTQTAAAGSGSAGDGCVADPGTLIAAHLDTAISTGLAGPVRARVSEDVYDSRVGECLVIPAGSVFIGAVARTEVRGSKRAEIVFTSIRRPWPKNDVIALNMPAADGMGRAGLPGRVNGHLASQAGLVLASTAVDLGRAALADGPFAVLGDNAGSPLEKAARDRLDRPPEIEIDPLRDDARLTIVLQEPIHAGDFRP